VGWGSNDEDGNDDDGNDGNGDDSRWLLRRAIYFSWANNQNSKNCQYKLTHVHSSYFGKFLKLHQYE